MSKNKQIEEMAKVIFSARDSGDIPYDVIKSLSRDLYRAGYRKASDVAEEIFAEIDKRFNALLKFYPLNGEVEDAKRFIEFHWKYIKNSIACDYYTELKKKYTLGEKGDEGK